MAGDEAAVPLEATAALVMAWAAPLYRDGPAGAFVSRLDLSGGDPLRSACEAVCPWYGEVICNRKAFIRGQVEGWIAGARDPCRVVVAAAGMSPLGIELAGTHPPDRLAGVVEFDRAGMEEKERLVAGCLAGGIECRTADVAGIGDLLPPGPVVLVLEGISYYLSSGEIRRVMEACRSPDRTNRVIIEYLAPCRMVAPERRAIPRGVFGRIRSACGMDAIGTWSPGEMDAIITGAGGEIEGRFSLCDMERSRTGTARRFPVPEAGWIWCTTARL
ncbi:MAG: hypothetical protein ACP5C4_06125 [Methanomicrobiales archaeon]